MFLSCSVMQFDSCLYVFKKSRSKDLYEKTKTMLRREIRISLILKENSILSNTFRIITWAV